MGWTSIYQLLFSIIMYYLVREIKGSPWNFEKHHGSSLRFLAVRFSRFKSCGPGSVHVQITGRWDRSVAGQRMGISHGITEVCGCLSDIEILKIGLWMFKWWYRRWSNYSTVVRLKSKQYSWAPPSVGVRDVEGGISQRFDLDSPQVDNLDLWRDYEPPYPLVI